MIARRLAVLLRCGALAAAALWLGACERHEAAAPPVRPVLTTAAAIQTTETFGPFAGTIEPRYQTALGFQIPGRMVARDFTIGDRVKKGARLAALDTTVLQFQVQSADADVANAQAQSANAAATEARQRALMQTGATTQAQLDNAVATRDTAAARLAQAQAALKKAQDQLGYSEIKADFDGVVTAWNAEVGQVVAAGQTVVTVARPDVREAVFDVPDALIGEIPRDAAFHVWLQIDDSVSAAGRVREIAPQADAATRTRRIRLSLDTAPQAFRLGTTVNISIPKPVAPRIVLPATALLEQDGRTGIWVVDASASKVKRVDVRVLARSADQVTIDASLGAGSPVVIAGVHSLREGQDVKFKAAP